jgi:hypothetical protein
MTPTKQLPLSFPPAALLRGARAFGIQASDIRTNSNEMINPNKIKVLAEFVEWGDFDHSLA